MDSEPATGEQLNPIMSDNTILVKGLNLHESKLKLYFSNQIESRGGDIKEIILKDKEAYITYVEPGGIKQLLLKY